MRRLGFRTIVVGSVAACTHFGCGSVQEAREPSSPRREPTRDVSELEANQILVGLRSSRYELSDCYASVPRRPGGWVQLTWTVQENGKAGTLEASGSHQADPRLKECLSEVIEHRRFLGIEKEARARWTFVHGLARETPPGSKQRTRKNRAKADEESTEQGLTLEPSSRGRVEESALERTMDRGFPLYGHCFRDALQRDVGLHGRVRLRWRIETDGSVASVVDVGSNVADPRVADCVAEGLYALTFPRPTGGPVEVAYSVLLNIQ